MAAQRFSKQFTIRYYEVNKYQEANPVSILNYLEETAIAHSEAVGLGIERLKALDVGWVLNHWRVSIARYPKWNEIITVETWPSSFVRFYATREFLIKDADGIVIGRVSSLWVFLNATRKRPQRIPEKFAVDYGIDEARAVTEAFSELPVFEVGEGSKEFLVRRNDIDTNNHVNNTKYLDWLLESVPEEIFEVCELADFEIIYKKETGYGTAISAEYQTISQAVGKIELIHAIKLQGSRECLALARTSWRKR